MEIGGIWEFKRFHFLENQTGHNEGLAFGYGLLTTRSTLANMASPDRGATGGIVGVQSLVCCDLRRVKQKMQLWINAHWPSGLTL